MRASVLFPVIAACAAGYTYGARRWMNRWGATDTEVGGPHPGDAVVGKPFYCTTHAVTVEAPPSAVWPWLAQIGYQRGGLYSYDWLDQFLGYLDRPSAEEILPQFQDISAGDVIPLGSGPDWPVHTAIPNRALVLAPEAPGFVISWAFILDHGDGGTTRLISRVRASTAAGLLTVLGMKVLLEPVAFLMERRMLLGIKERAERLHRQVVVSADTDIAA